MSEGLFREEVIQARQDERIGKVGLRAPRVGWTLFAIGIAAVFALLCLLTVGRYTRHERVSGVLVPASGLISVSSNDPGVASRVLVREGEVVASGQVLVEISITRDSVALGETQALVAQQLRAKQTGLNSDLALNHDLGAMQRDALRSRLGSLRGQLQEKVRQAALQKQRADGAEQLYQEWVEVESTQVVSRYQMLQQRDTVLQHRTSQIELEAQSRLLQQQIEQVGGDLAQLEPALQGRDNQTRREVADVERALVENAAQTAVALRARVDGTVTNVLVKPGQSLAAGQSALSLVPKDSALIAELWVPSGAIGFVDVGKPVTIRYDAYPFQKFGLQRGRVLTVSRSAASPDAQARLLGTSVQAPRYRVEVELEQQAMTLYGREEALKPGMALDAEISLESRRLIEWIFEPLYGLAARRRPVDASGASAR